MDRRYYLIILILIACCINLYIVADNSNVVGTASVTFDKYIISLPLNYEVTGQYGSYVQIHNNDIGFLAIQCKNDSFVYNYSSVVNELNKKYNCTILNNGTINTNDIPVNTIYYKTVDEKNFVNNRSIFYFEKYGKTFQIEMNGFNYDNDVNKTIDTLTYVVESLRVNYKI